MKCFVSGREKRERRFNYKLQSVELLSTLRYTVVTQYSKYIICWNFAGKVI